MFSRFIIVSLFYSSLFLPVANAQVKVLDGEARVRTERDILAAYPNHFHAVDIISIKRLDRHYLRLNYKSDGKQWEAVLQTDDTDPVLVETAQVLPPEGWPGFIIAACKKSEFASWQIIKVLKVSSPYGDPGYRVDVCPDLDQKAQTRRLYFDPFGQPDKPIF
ncbi:MAG: hypothetical protein IPL65_20610 [Lewinellaceae bacterium]|nr:hypothetical protein [Lewinellaceae bacterium]